MVEGLIAVGAICILEIISFWYTRTEIKTEHKYIKAKAKRTKAKIRKEVLNIVNAALADKEEIAAESNHFQDDNENKSKFIM